MLSFGTASFRRAGFCGIAITPVLSSTTAMSRSTVLAFSSFAVPFAVRITSVSLARRLIFLMMTMSRWFSLLLGTSSSPRSFCLQRDRLFTWLPIRFLALRCLRCRRCRAGGCHYAQRSCATYFLQKRINFLCIQSDGQYLPATSLQCL